MANFDDHSRGFSTSRRHFLRRVCALPISVLTPQVLAPVVTAQEPQSQLPQIPFGRCSVSRLICGANPFNAGSHLSVFVNREMRVYYTQEQILRTLRRCQEVGINCWQSGSVNIDTYRRFCDEGGRMHYIALGADHSDSDGEINALVKIGCIGIAHHGEVTDSLFKQGKIDTIRDYLERVRDTGMQVGVSTHMPAVVDYIESEEWDIDFYMTCVYERHRSVEELEDLLGQAPIPVGEVYLSHDPPRMFAAMRQTEKPCLAFKILAAGRLSDRPEWVEQAFRETFASIKPNDAIIVGIYDRYDDQAGVNAEFARRFSPLSGSVAVSSSCEKGLT